MALVDRRASIQSIDRAAAILRLLASGPRRLGVSELADRLGLARPTVHGLLQTLLANGFVEQDRHSDKYQLGAGLLQLGYSYLDLNELRSRSIGHADQLANRTGAAVRVGVRHGASVVVSHKAPGYSDEIMKATGGKGVNLIVEMAAHLNLDRDLGLLAKYGRVVVVGNRGKTEIDARQAMGRDAAILGMTLFNVTEVEFVEIHAALIAGLANGTLNPVVGREIPMGEAPRAHEAVMEPGALGKIVLIP